ncbi:MAG: hypothetical protein HYT37_04205 [Candidatus Sungbacteria bacterium]|nr:hypothetical protein [Candidatus Sungbacteria bacterium]
MDNKSLPSIQEVVLGKIKAGSTHMRPRWFFLLYGFFGTAGFLALLLVMLYFTSFIIFLLRKTGVWFLPSFGAWGLKIFLLSLPWVLIISSIVFLFLLEAALRRYSFAYRKPILYSLGGIVVIIIAADIAVSMAGIHETLLLHARDGRLPVAGRLYRSYGMQESERVYLGVVKQMIEEGMLVETVRGETLIAVVLPETRFPFGIDFERGDMVLVIGEKSGNAIMAQGIRKIYMIERPMRRRGWYKPPVTLAP